jgi:hypothetical protein
MFNIAPGHETGYFRFTSPADTKWATSVMAANTGKTITATNWQNLAFTDWAPAYDGPGSALIGNITTHNAVVHLVTDDIYLNLLFTDFNSSGDFAYQRSAPSVDYNGNGNVDAADYVVWRKTDGTPAGYNVWRTRFGQPVGSGAGANAVVPEPGTAILFMGGLLTMVCRQRVAAS